MSTEQTTPAAAEAVAATPAPKGGGFNGTGRRKSSVARVILRPGNGKISINERELDAFFTEVLDRADVLAPLAKTGTAAQWNVIVNVHGGGHTGQAGAIRLGIARALVRANVQHEPALRAAGFLTRDARRVERKKPGRRKARRSFQFSKR